MLSYRHSFHAGNHADVLKHIVQLLILQSLKQKEKGFLYLDTHSGTGRYSLFSAESEKTSEYLEGVARLWERDDLPEEVALYIDELKKINRGGKLKYYAGSPLLAVNQLRPQDRAILTELHPNDFPLLRQEFAKNELVVKAIEEGYKRFATGVYAIWYPVVLRQHSKRIVRGLQETGIRKILQIELAVRPDSDQRGMTASGMIVINPPWQLESQMKKILPYLTEVLVPEGTGSWTVDWITPE